MGRAIELLLWIPWAAGWLAGAMVRLVTLTWDALRVGYHRGRTGRPVSGE